MLATSNYQRTREVHSKYTIRVIRVIRGFLLMGTTNHTNDTNEENLIMIIFDAHLDLAWNAIDFNRDLRQSVADIRRSEAGMPGKSRGCNTVSFPELRRGGVVIFIATLLARLLRSGPNLAVQRYTSMEAAYGAACGQLAYYRAMEREGWLRWIRSEERRVGKGGRF